MGSLDQHRARRACVGAVTNASIGHRPLVVQGTTVDRDRVEIDLAGPSAAALPRIFLAGSTPVCTDVILAVRFTEQRIVTHLERKTATVCGRS